MTILGATTSRAGVTVWSDSELYSFGEIFESATQKIDVYPISACIAFSSGIWDIGLAARDFMRSVVDFDQAVDFLPDALASFDRDFKAEMRKKCVGFNENGTTFYVAGRSEKFGMYIIASFCSSTNFRVRFHREVTAPVIDAGPSGEPNDSAIINAATEQLDRFRVHVPQATGGVLIVARLVNSAITIRKIFDFPKPPAEDFARNSLASGSPAPAVLHVRSAPVMMDYAAE